MGTFLPVLGTISTTLGTLHSLGKTFNTLSGNDYADAKRDQAMRDLQRQQAQQQSEAQQRADQQRQQIALNAEQAEQARRSALKRAMAKRNARFGASGIGGANGSREAIMLGLYNESEDEKKQREALDKIRYDSITSDLNNLNSRNILERTEMAENNRLSRLADSY